MTLNEVAEQEGKVLSKFVGPTADGGKALWWTFKDYSWELEIYPDNTGVWCTFKYQSDIPSWAGEIPADQMLEMARYIIDNHERMEKE